LSNWTAEQSTAAGACRVTYSAHTGQGGVAAKLTLTNKSATPWPGWTLRFSFTGNEKLTSGSSATWTQHGREVTARADAHHSVPPGATVTVGFTAARTGQQTPPTKFTVNGQICMA